MTLDLQEPLFRWVASQPASTGFVIMLAGAVCGFYGYRFFKPLLVVSNALVGCVLGRIAAEYVDVPPSYLVAAGAAVLGAIAFRWPVFGVMSANFATWALVGAYLIGQIGFPMIVSVLGCLLFGAIGGVLAVLCVRTMRVVLMAVQGSILLIVGFVGLSSQALPTLGDTFRSLAASFSLMVPVLLTMTFVATYACQSNLVRGDIRSGARTT